MIPRNQRRRWLFRGVVVHRDNGRAYFALECGCCGKIAHRLNFYPLPCSICRKLLYGTWKLMIRRCTDPRNRNYKQYGGRGIFVCERWRSSFQAFMQDVGFRDHPKLSIDRIDNDGNYEPGNVRWATWKEQAANKRPRAVRAALAQSPDRLAAEVASSGRAADADALTTRTPPP